jgi:hypothetical protein
MMLNQHKQVCPSYSQIHLIENFARTHSLGNQLEVHDNGALLLHRQITAVWIRSHACADHP